MRDGPRLLRVRWLLRSSRVGSFIHFCFLFRSLWLTLLISSYCPPRQEGADDRSDCDHYVIGGHVVWTWNGVEVNSTEENDIGVRLWPDNPDFMMQVLLVYMPWI